MTSVVKRPEQDDSGEYSDASQDNDPNHRKNDPTAPESDYDSHSSDDTETDKEDSGSQDAEKPVDDDEDRSNPQYIPKRGTFYEHDDRTAAGGEDTTTTSIEGEPVEKEGSGGVAGDAPAERRRPPRKSEICDKWSHDKFNENDQKPKSRDELVAVYGYDIRNEESPPNARRIRRYGRGPTKYTRTWEDEEAYKRQANATPIHRKPPNLEDFPELDSTKKIRKGRMPRSRSQPSDSNESLDNGHHLRRNPSIKSQRPQGNVVKQNLANKNIPSKQNAVKPHFNKGANRQGGNEKLPPLENLTINATLNNTSGQSQRKVNSNVAQQRPVPTMQTPTTPSAQKKINQPQTSNQQMHNSTGRVLHNQQSLQQSKGQQQPPQQQTGVGESKPGAKRYSSLRQRPLAENYTPQPPQRYIPDYQQSPPVTQHQGSTVSQIPPQLMHQVIRGQVGGSPHGPSPPHQALPQLPPQQLPPQQLPPQQLPPQQLPPQQLPPQQLPPQQLPPQQLPPQHVQNQLSQSQIAPNQLPQSQIPQNQLPPPQLAQNQLGQPQLAQNPLGQPQLAQNPLGQQQLAQNQLPQPQHSQGQHPQQVRLNIMDQQQLVPHAHPHPLHNLQPAHTIGPLQPAPGYAPPTMIPTQYLQGANNAAVFGGTPMYAQPPAPYPHQLYQHHNYASAGGVTYYSPAEQAEQPRAQRRPTAAIPIVRPNQDRSGNATEKDNIDRIVENMFVRKPWPSAKASDSSKEKSQENRNSQEPISKDQSQPNSLTSSSISTDSRPSSERNEPKEQESKLEGKEIIDSIESTRTSEDKDISNVDSYEQKVEDSLSNNA